MRTGGVLSPGFPALEAGSVCAALMGFLQRCVSPTLLGYVREVGISAGVFPAVPPAPEFFLNSVHNSSDLAT